MGNPLIKLYFRKKNPFRDQNWPEHLKLAILGFLGFISLNKRLDKKTSSVGKFPKLWGSLELCFFSTPARWGQKLLGQYLVMIYSGKRPPVQGVVLRERKYLNSGPRVFDPTLWDLRKHIVLKISKVWETFQHWMFYYSGVCTAWKQPKALTLGHYSNALPSPISSCKSMTNYKFHKDYETKKKKPKINRLHTEPKINMLINPNWPELLYATLNRTLAFMTGDAVILRRERAHRWTPAVKPSMPTI